MIAGMGTDFPPEKLNTPPASGAFDTDLDALNSTLSTPLRDYQLLCARAIVDSVARGSGHIITVMFARQMGKNELSAQVEAFLLRRYAERGGAIVKAAPSFRPQIAHSMLRLKLALDQFDDAKRPWRAAHGFTFQLGKASIAFFSAAPHANVVGATASLLLEIDEAQDVDPEKYDREFRPMASSTNATTVLYGTAWNEDSLLQRQRAINLEQERRTGTKLHFEYDWRTLAAQSSVYKTFVEAEIARLGEDHPSIQTQYLLHCLSDAGRLFSSAQRETMSGIHPRQRRRTPGALYVAGIDVAGADEQAQDAQARALSPRRDSTVVTIAELVPSATGSSQVRVVDHIWWTGHDQVWQFDHLLRLWDHWQFARVCVDASGIGDGLASFLLARHGPRVEKFVFSAPSKSRLAYTMLGMVNTGRLSLYGRDGSPEWRECWEEIRATRYTLHQNEQLAWEVPPTEGHDDFVISLALCCRAAEDMAPLALGGLVRARADGEGGW